MENAEFTVCTSRFIPSLIHGVCAIFASNSRFMRLFQAPLDTCLDSPLLCQPLTVCTSRFARLCTVKDLSRLFGLSSRLLFPISSGSSLRGVAVMTETAKGRPPKPPKPSKPPGLPHYAVFCRTSERRARCSPEPPKPSKPPKRLPPLDSTPPLSVILIFGAGRSEDLFRDFWGSRSQTPPPARLGR